MYEEVTTCPVCGDTRGTRDVLLVTLPHEKWNIYDRDETRYSICDCGAAFQNPMPTPNSLREFYRTEYRGLCADDPCGRKRAVWVVGYFPAEPGAMLDVGCSAGDLMALAKERGWRVAGVEPTDITRERAIRIGPVYNALDEVTAKFDLVTTIHVLEHVPSPVDFLRQIADLLKPQGTVLVVVPRNLLGAPHLLAIAERQARTIFARADLDIDLLETVVVGGHGRQDIIVRAHDSSTFERGEISEHLNK